MANQYPTGYPPVPVSSGLMNSPHSYSGSPGPMSMNPGMTPMSAGMGPGMGGGMNPGMGPGMNPNMGGGMPPGMNIQAGMPQGMNPGMAPSSNMPGGMGMGGMPPSMHGNMQPGMPSGMSGGMPGSMTVGMQNQMSGGMPTGMPSGMGSGMPSVLSNALGGSIPPSITSRMSPAMSMGQGMQHPMQGMQGPMPPNMPVPMTGGMSSGMVPGMPMQYSMGPVPNNSVQGPPNMVQGAISSANTNNVICDPTSVGGTNVVPARLATPASGPENTTTTTSSRDINTAFLCRIGQETVQDIVSRTQEIYQTLKQLQPPNGTAAGANAANEKKIKVQEQLRTIRKLFKTLRLIYEKCNDNSQLQGLEYTHIESLIPLKDEWDGKSEEKKNSEAYRGATEEYKELVEAVGNKNKILKDIIDHVRRIIWEINTMLMMRRS